MVIVTENLLEQKIKLSHHFDFIFTDFCCCRFSSDRLEVNCQYSCNNFSSLAVCLDMSALWFIQLWEWGFYWAISVSICAILPLSGWEKINLQQASENVPWHSGSVCWRVAC